MSTCYAQEDDVGELARSFRQSQKITPRYGGDYGILRNIFYLPEEGRIYHREQPFFWEEKKQIKEMTKKIQTYFEINEEFNDNIFQVYAPREPDLITRIPVGIKYGPSTFLSSKGHGRGLSAYLGMHFINYLTHRLNSLGPDIILNDQGLFNGRADANFSLQRAQEVSSNINSAAPAQIWDYWSNAYGIRFHPNKKRTFFWNVGYQHYGSIYDKEQEFNNSNTDTFSAAGYLRVSPKTTLSFGIDHTIDTYPHNKSGNETGDVPWVGIDEKISRTLSTFAKFGYAIWRPKPEDMKISTGPVINIGLRKETSRRFSWDLTGWQDNGQATDITQGHLTQTGVSAGSHYLVSRRQTISGYGSYYIDDYKYGRKDRVLNLGLSTHYKIKKWLSLVLEYRFTKDVSNQQNLGYYNNAISLRLTKELQ